MTTINRFARLLCLLGFSLITFSACDAPTSGNEIYDGDPETSEDLPEEMEERAEEERQDSTLE